jgi:hypothetical protein
MNELCTSLRFDGTDSKAIFDFVGGRIEEQASLEIVFSKKLPAHMGEECLGDFCERKLTGHILNVIDILSKTINQKKIVELKYASIYASTEGAEITMRWPV